MDDLVTDDRRRFHDTAARLYAAQRLK